MGKLLSICIPTLQRKDSVKSVLDGLLEVVRRHRDEVEICVSDNGSSDGTYEMLTAYCRKHPFIRARRNSENLGFDSNFASLMKMAEGRYCWPIGDDDEIIGEGVEDLIALLKRQDWVAGLVFAGLEADRNVMGRYFPAESYTRDEFVSHYIDYIRHTEYFAPGFGFLGCFLYRTDAMKRALKRFEGKGYGWMQLSMYLHIISQTDGNIAIARRSAIKYGSPPDKVYYPDQELYTFSERKLKAMQVAELRPELKTAVESVLTNLDKQYVRGLLELILIKDIVSKERYERSRAKITQIGKNVKLLSLWGLLGVLMVLLERVPGAAYPFRLVPKLNNYSRKIRKHEEGLLRTNEEREALDKWEHK